MSARITVSIVNWNTREQLRRCLAAVESAGGALEIETIVVDNASGDGSAGMVAAAFPYVRLIALDRNVGFAAGNNAAIREATGDHVLVLNPDVRIDRQALDALSRHLEANPEVAAVSPLLVGPDGRPHTHLYRRFPSFMQVVLFWTLFEAVAGRIGALRRRWLEYDLRRPGPIPVDQLPGAAMLVRRSAFEDVGEMDPDYFIWFEDVDWSFRARRAGHALHVLPEVRVEHEGGASFRSWSVPRRMRQFYCAFLRFLCKHRLDRLRRWAFPVLMLDLYLKGAVVRAARLLGREGYTGAGGLAPMRRAVREVVARCRAGDPIRFDADGLVGSAAAPEHTRIAAPEVPSPRASTDPDRAHVDAVIVNWNGRDYLPRCLDALSRSTIPARVIVVDNASGDGSVAYLRKERPGVDVVALDANVGYAEGANVGLRRGSAPYAIVMNPDVALAPDHLERLVARCADDARIGAAQGKLYATSPDDFLAGRVPARPTIDSAGHAIRRSRMVVDRGQGRPDGPEFDREAAVFSACGAALFLRRAMLEDVAVDGEFFDASFFAYKEDIDLCWRARLRGWDVRCVPAAVAYHVRSWAGSRLPPKSCLPPVARRHSWKNHYLLMIKNDRWSDLLRALPAIVGWEAVRHGYALLRDPAVWGAYPELARLLPSAWRRRRIIQRGRRVAPDAMRRWFGGNVVPAAVEASVPAMVGITDKG